MLLVAGHLALSPLILKVGSVAMAAAAPAMLDQLIWICFANCPKMLKNVDSLNFGLFCLAFLPSLDRGFY